MAKAKEVKAPKKAAKKVKTEGQYLITAGRFKGETFVESHKEVVIFDDAGKPIAHSKAPDFNTALENCHNIEKYTVNDGPFSYGTVKGFPHIIRRDDLE